MSILRGLRVVNSVESGTTTGTQLETLLSTDAGRLAEFNAVLGLKGQAKRLVNSTPLMTALVTSATASGTIQNNPVLLGELAQSYSGLSTVFNSTSARESFLGAKSQVGKGLDTIILNDTAVSNNVLSGQRTIANVLTNSASTIATSTSVISILAGSALSRAAIAANESAKQTIAGYDINVAKLVEGELGNNPVTTTSLDTVLNTNGRITSILANTFCKQILTAASSPTAKFLAKAIGLNPVDYSSFSIFYGDATRWDSVVANSTLKVACLQSKYIRSTLASSAFNKFSQLVISSTTAETKPYWNFAKSSSYANYYLANYMGEGNFLGGYGWVYNNKHYCIFKIQWGSHSSYGTSQLYLWTSDDTSSNPRNVNATYGQNGYPYTVKKCGNFLYYISSNQTAGSYTYFPADMTYNSTGTTVATGHTSEIFNISYNGSNLYALACANGMYKSSTGTSNWTAAATSLGAVYFTEYIFNKFIAIAGSNNVYTSTDANTWTLSGTLPGPSNSSNIPYYDTKLVTNGTVALLMMRQDAVVFRTTDAATWTKITLPEASTAVYGLEYMDGLFYLAAANGVYTSSDGNTWTKITIDPANSNSPYYFIGLAATDKFMMSLGVGYVTRNIGL